MGEVFAYLGNAVQGAPLAALAAAFAGEIASGLLRWQPLNVQAPEGRHAPGSIAEHALIPYSTPPREPRKTAPSC